MTDAETAAAETDGPPNPRDSSRRSASWRTALRLASRTFRSVIRALFIVFLLIGVLVGSWGAWLYYTGSAPGVPEVRDTLAGFDVSIPLWVPAEIRNALQPAPAVTETQPIDDGNGAKTTSLGTTTDPADPVTAKVEPGQTPETTHGPTPVPEAASIGPDSSTSDYTLPGSTSGETQTAQPAMPAHPLTQQPDTLLPDGLVLPPSPNEQTLALIVETRLRPIEEHLARISPDFTKALESKHIEVKNVVETKTATLTEDFRRLQNRQSEFEIRLSSLENRLHAVDSELSGVIAQIESLDTRVEAALAETRQLRDLTQQDVDALHNIVGGLRRHVITIGQSVSALTSEFYLSRSYVQPQADPGALSSESYTPPTADYSFGAGQGQLSDGNAPAVSNQVPGQAPTPLVITNSTHAAGRLPFGTHRIGDYIEGYGTILAITRDADGEHLTTERGVIFISSAEPESLPQPDTTNNGR